MEDAGLIRALIETHPFATLVVTVNGRPDAIHVPVLLDADGKTLYGHMSRASPQWRTFDGQRESLVIFCGPDCYVSPVSYRTVPAVPTWNYLAVHVYGAPALLDDDGLKRALDRAVSRFDDAWPADRERDYPDDYRDRLSKQIVGFRMPVTRIQAQFKLSQDKTPEDRARVIKTLESGSGEERSVAAWMRRINDGN